MRQLVWRCPGCKCSHGVPVSTPNLAGVPLWEWNGSIESPTLSPSIRVSYGDYVPKNRPAVCHFFIRDGKIEFCGDSQHELSGKTVPMSEFPEPL